MSCVVHAAAAAAAAADSSSGDIEDLTMTLFIRGYI